MQAWHNPNIHDAVLGSDIELDPATWRASFAATGGVAVLTPKLSNLTIQSGAGAAVLYAARCRSDAGRGCCSPEAAVGRCAATLLNCCRWLLLCAPDMSRPGAPFSLNFSSMVAALVVCLLANSSRTQSCAAKLQQP